MLSVQFFILILCLFSRLESLLYNIWDTELNETWSWARLLKSTIRETIASLQKDKILTNLQKTRKDEDLKTNIS